MSPCPAPPPLPSPLHPNPRLPFTNHGQALLAEFVGTAFLVIVTRLTTRADVEQRYLALAMTLSALIYAFDHVSGAHFNPAVTLGMVASRRVHP